MKLASFVLLIALTAASLTGQTVSLPDNNPALGPASTQPFNHGTSWRYLYVLDAKKLGTQMFKITEIAFAPSNTALFTASQFQVRMAHTTMAVTGNGCFDDFLGSVPIIVHDGPLSWKATKDTWSPIGLQTSFLYNGRQNVAVEIRFRGGSAGGGPGSRNGVSLHIDSGALSLVVDPGMSADPYSTKCGSQTRGVPKIELRYETSQLVYGYESARIGSRTSFGIRGQQGQHYQLAASFGQGRLKIGSHTIGLDLDPLFLLSATNSAAAFYHYNGTFAFAGTGGSVFLIPDMKQLAGTIVYHAAVTYDTRITGCTNTLGLMITP